jgi:hypothetical protein
VNPSHIDIWEAWQECREGFNDPSADRPLAGVTISKNWIKGFDTLDKWIGSHVRAGSGGRLETLLLQTKKVWEANDGWIANWR